MIVKTRTTAQGTEYWDTKEKRSLFVQKGKKAGFEVTEDPKSMVGGVDLASGKDMTVIDGKVVDDGHNPNVGVADETHPSLKDLNKEQLLEFAKQNEIDVPGNMSKEETIRKHIAESLVEE